MYIFLFPFGRLTTISKFLNRLSLIGYSSFDFFSYPVIISTKIFRVFYSRSNSFLPFKVFLVVVFKRAPQNHRHFHNPTWYFCMAGAALRFSTRVYVTFIFRLAGCPRSRIFDSFLFFFSFDRC